MTKTGLTALTVRPVYFAGPLGKEIQPRAGLRAPSERPKTCSNMHKARRRAYLTIVMLTLPLSEATISKCSFPCGSITRKVQPLWSLPTLFITL